MEKTSESMAKEAEKSLVQKTRTELWRLGEQRRHLKRQLSVTDRLLGMIENALEDERELYRYLQSSKSGGAVETSCEERQIFNEERLGKIVKALSELIGIQNEILAVPLFKENADAENSKAKLQSDRDISLRKIEIELMKVDGAECQSVPEQLLAALSGDENDT